MINRPLLTAVLLLSSTGCAVEDGKTSQTHPIASRGEPVVCAAFRGNGPRITSHFSSLARYTEHYGLPGGIAGGSSGSITALFVDSIVMNPHVYQCGARPCDEAERWARAALLLKSFQGAQELLASRGLDTLSTVRREVEEQAIPQLLEEDPERGVQQLLEILEAEEIRDAVNPEVVELLRSSPDPVFHARDILEATGGVAFEASSPDVFLRPGVLSFPALVELLGRLASFYAGYAPVDGPALDRFLDACATATRGRTWRETSETTRNQVRCGESFRDVLSRFLADFAPEVHPSRADDWIGAGMPVAVATSVLEGAAARTFTEAQARYWSAEPYTFDVSFDDVKFGYWTSHQHARMLESAPPGDAMGAKLSALGPTTWRDALSRSPAEPGLSSALPMANGDVSAGGWSDPFPVRVLEAMGCDEVVLFTRPGAMDGGFVEQVARQLGMTDAERLSLYELEAPDSAAALALEHAGAVWCSDWDTPDVTSLDDLSSAGFDAPMETAESYFLDAGSAYPHAGTALGILGCTPLSRRE